MKAVQLNSHFRPGYRVSRRHNSFPLSTYHRLSLSLSSNACNNSVRDHVGDLGEVSAEGDGGSGLIMRVFGLVRVSAIRQLLLTEGYSWD